MRIATIAALSALAIACGSSGGGGGDEDASPDAAPDAPIDAQAACGSETVPRAMISQTDGLAIAADGTVFFSVINGAPKEVGRWRPGDAAPDVNYALLPDAGTLIRGLALRDDGTLFVASGDNGGVIFTIDTNITSPTPTPFVTSAGLADGVTIGPDGALYYSDSDADLIFRVSAAGVVSNVTAPGEPLPGANALFFDDDGSLLVATLNPGEVWRLTLDGTGSETARRREIDLANTGAFLDGIGRDDQGRYYVTDATNGLLLRFDDAFGSGSPIEIGLPAPANIAFGRSPLQCGVYVATQGGDLGFHAEEILGAP